MKPFPSILRISYKDHITSIGFWTEWRKRLDHTKIFYPQWRDEKWDGVCSKINRTCQNNSARRQKERQTEKEMGGQHQRVDTPPTQQAPESIWDPGEMEEDCCDLFSGDPAVSKLHDSGIRTEVNWLTGWAR